MLSLKPLCLLLVLAAAGAEELTDHFVIGTTLTDGDVHSANVYDGRLTMNPVHADFSEKYCACTEQQYRNKECGHGCHMEIVTSESSNFYAQNAGSSNLRFRSPVITHQPIYTTNTKYIDLVTAASVQPPSTTALKPEEIATIELDFRCETKQYDLALGQGVFHVTVSMEIGAQGKFKNVTWHFRKLCIAEGSAPKGLSITYDNKPVVRDGEVVEKWRPEDRAFDVGYDPSDKDIVFGLQYIYSGTETGLNQVKFDTMQPVFDQTLIKSVTYKNAYASGSGTFRHGATHDPLVVRVTCQKNPEREASPADIRVGFSNLIDAQGVQLKPVEFKFQVECPYHGHNVTPLGVLAIVIFGYIALGCAGGFAYNVYYTNRRGVNAIPMIDAYHAISGSPRRKHKHFPEVHEQEEVDLLEEEVMPAVSHRAEYGAI